MLWCNDMVEDRHCERAMQEIISQSSSTVSHSLVQINMNSPGVTSSTRVLPQNQLAMDIAVRDRAVNCQATARPRSRRNLFGELSILVLLCCCASTQSFCPRLTARRQSRLLVALDNDEVTNVVSVLATLKTVVTPDQVVVPLTKPIQSFFSSQPYVSAFVTAGVKASAADLVAQVNENNQDDEGVDQENYDPENVSVEPEDLVDVMETEAVAAPVSSVVIQATSELDMTPAVNPVLSAVALEEVAPPSFDFSRNGAFLLYGGCYCGMFQELLFTKLYPVWFGPTVTQLPENVLEYHWPTIVTTVLFDNFLAAPFLCLPVLYVVKAFCTGADVATTTATTSTDQPALAGMADTIRNALDRYKADVQLQGLLFKYWAIWLPVQCCTFSIVPMQYRVIFVAAVSFLWVIILSSISSSSSVDRDSAAAAMPQVD
jgi:Mpv17 / PMP22 family